MVDRLTSLAEDAARLGQKFRRIDLGTDVLYRPRI
jgi:hypothetical protein